MNPSGQGLADGWDGQEVGGAGQQETSRCRRRIHQTLDSPNNAIATELYLVHSEQSGLIGQESDRIVQGSFSGRVIVKRRVSTISLGRDEPSKRRLPRYLYQPRPPIPTA